MFQDIQSTAQSELDGCELPGCKGREVSNRKTKGKNQAKKRKRQRGTLFLFLRGGFFTSTHTNLAYAQKKEEEMFTQRAQPIQSNLMEEEIPKNTNQAESICACETHKPPGGLNKQKLSARPLLCPITFILLLIKYNIG